MHDAPTYERLCVNASWLITLRWVAAFGQLVTVAIVFFVLDVTIPIAPLVTLIFVTVLSNVLFAWWFFAIRRRVPTSPPGDATHVDATGGWSTSGCMGATGGWSTSAWLTATVTAIMLLDLFNLTGLLYFTGGPTNPFFVFYLVNLGLAAIVLPARWAWVLNGLAIVCMAFLFWDHVPVDPLPAIGRDGRLKLPGRLSLAARGLFVAFVTCSSVVVYFTTRLTGELRRREQELLHSQVQRARNEKIEALGTLAAGAAHELATPLSTIAVVVKELERELAQRDMPAAVIDDMQMIRAELDRCRTILDRMSTASGQAVGEGLVRVSGAELIRAVMEPFDRQAVVQATCHRRAAECQLHVPLQMLAQALRGIVQNAVDADSGAGPVRVSADCDDTDLTILVRDRGPGMTLELLQRAEEPFFTTKEPGSGMGMGLFLARSVIERLDGTLEIQSSPGKGTTVRVAIPLQQ